MEITQPDKKPTRHQKRGGKTQGEIMSRLLYLSFFAYLVLVAIFAFGIFP